jgi:ribonucleoside-diphosphate reductase alpha chain
MPHFRNEFARTIFENKYAHEGAKTWPELARTVVDDVCDPSMMPPDERDQLVKYIEDMKFIPGGRYLYYAGRQSHYWNNCALLKAEEDTRQDWAYLSWKAESCLMTGMGIGADYSIYRGEGSDLGHTGGKASGPLPKIEMTNEIGRRVMQGGTRRSAMYASLDRTHADIWKFLDSKNWQDQEIVPGISHWDAKQHNFNHHAPLDMTNISVNYKTDWLKRAGGDFDQATDLYNVWCDRAGAAGDHTDPVFRHNVEQALKTGEPGFSFNFFDKENETLRNACTEVTSEDDSDICNLGSLNLGRIETLEELYDVVQLATKFLLCGSLGADVPYQKMADVRTLNRRLGLGLMGIHEWLLKRGYKYEVTDELHMWLDVYGYTSQATANKFSDELGCTRPVATRAIAPTGTIGILAGTTTGIEPVFATAYKRRYLKNGSEWHYQYVVDSAAQDLINVTGVDPDSIESALSLSTDYERRIKFQADIQDYVDMAISSTINLPAWGTEGNNEDMVDDFALTLAKYAPRLRGFTCYPDGSRGGQPLTPVSYSEASNQVGREFPEVATHDVCSITGKGGSCGV